MTALQVMVEDARCRFRLAGPAEESSRVVDVPIGSVALARTQLTSDPPHPAELTNAIGAVADYLDDVLRELPGILDAGHVRVGGPDVVAIACVEAGRVVDGPFELSREAAEDVFRTLATERRVDRARNPGLAAERLDTVVGGCCVVVALMRLLHLDAITVCDPGADIDVVGGGA